MKLFDAQAWTGAWPFSFLEENDCGSLRRQLKSNGIERALVSDLGAVFQPEPGPSNRRLLGGVRGKEGLLPVPVINPALANWREELEACAAHPDVRAVRILPNYHGYRLPSRGANALAEELGRRGLRLVVQVRLIDERHEYHALRIRGVPMAALEAFLLAHPGLSVLACGLLRAELFLLAGRCPGLLADLSYVEWHETLRDVSARVHTSRIAFASHTPFLHTAAAAAKLNGSGVSGRVRDAVASGNLERWLGLGAMRGAAAGQRA